MSIINALSKSIVSALTTVTDVADTAGKAVSIGTQYVDHRAKKFTIVDQLAVRTATAEDLADLSARLDNNEKAKEHFIALEDMFN
jgi:hypothetical protein